MRLEEIIWLDAIIEKLAVKHRVEANEVEIDRFNKHPVALAGWYIADAAAPIGENTWRNALGSASAAIEAASLLIDNKELAVYRLLSFLFGF